MLKITFEKFADTKNKTRYNETDAEGKVIDQKSNDAVIGSLYVRQAESKDLPDNLTVLVGAEKIIELVGQIHVALANEDDDLAKKMSSIEGPLGELFDALNA
jgi:hypothetical protein